MGKVEQELKIPVAELEPVRCRLRELAASRRTPSELEENWVLDDETGALRRAGRLLRVRSVGGRHLVTLKGPARFSGKVKERDELEVDVASAEGLLEVFAHVGFTPFRRYQKRRETWQLAGAEVALDETPMGDFVEIEGDASTLDGLARSLGLDPGRAVRGSYLALWEAYRDAHPQAGEDMVFG